MALKINDVRTAVTVPSTGPRAGGLNHAPVVGQNQGQAPVARPAASVDLSEAAQAASQLASSGAASEALDLDLVREIRERIASGAFDIDYNKIAGNLLNDAVAAINASKQRR